MGRRSDGVLRSACQAGVTSSAITVPRLSVEGALAGRAPRRPAMTLAFYVTSAGVRGGAGVYMQVPDAAPGGMLQVPVVHPTVAVHIGRQVVPPLGPTHVSPGAQVSAKRHVSPVLAVPAQSHSVVVAPDG